MRYTVHHQSVLDWAKEYEGPKFHSILCDPPYHLTSITERFGKQGSAPAKHGTDGAFQRASKGFMNSQWDGGDIAFRSETWAALAEHLYPGAFGMAFASSRGWHRMAVAIEDAGLIIHPTIFRVTTVDGETLFCYAEDVAALLSAGIVVDNAARVYDIPGMLGWSFGSGFPKATNIATRIDKRVGATPKVVGIKKQGGAKFKQTQALIDNGGFNDPERSEYELTEPSTDVAKAFKGYRYGAQAIKPAIEPIIVFQKPYSGDAVSSIVATGAGALNIDGARVGLNSERQPSGSGRGFDAVKGFGQASTSATKGERITYTHETQTSVNGRWPANLILEHAPGCVSVGTKRIKSAKGEADRTKTGNPGVTRIVTNVKTGAHHGDATGHETVTDWQCVEGCPVRMLDEQSEESVSKLGIRGGTSPNPMSWHESRLDGDRISGYNDSGTASRFFFNADWQLNQLENADPIAYVPKASTAERDAGLYHFPPITVGDGRETPIDNAYQRGETARYNPHPTIKPLSLIKYLATLLLPPDMYAPNRRILVPFSGVNSEVIGALLAGWDEVTGIELEAKHVEYAIARTDWWLEASRVAITTEPKEILARVDESASVLELKRQVTLFDMMAEMKTA